MADLKLLEVTAIDVITLRDADLRWEASKKARARYDVNFTRMARMIEAPIFAALIAEVHRISIQRIFKCDPTDEDFKARMPILGVEVDRLMGEMINVPRDQQRNMLVAAAHNLNGFIQSTTNVNMPFESLLGAIAIQAWMAFEVLAGDLCNFSRAEHPECFSHLTGKEDFRFQRRLFIRASYDTAFQQDAKINCLLNRQCLDSLSLLRNLLVHQGGMVNDIFRKGCIEAHLMGWAALPNGSPISPFDGDVLKRLVNETLECAMKLIKAVDARLTELLPK